MVPARADGFVGVLRQGALESDEDTMVLSRESPRAEGLDVDELEELL